MANPQEALDHLKALVNDEQYFSARWLKLAQEKSGFDVEQLAVGLSVIVGSYLLLGEQAQFVCNFLLTAVPIILTYVYPNESPPVAHLLLYCLLDRGCEAILPAYYLIKMALLLSLFLKPFQYAKVISQYIILKNEDGKKRGIDLEKLTELAKGRRSPPPEKPEDDEKKMVRSGSQRSKFVLQPAQIEEATSLRAIPQKKTNTEAEPDIQTAAARTPVQPKTERNRMRNESARFAISRESGSEDEGIETFGANAPVNLNDFVTQPQSRIVFNAPFDVDDLSYHMKIMNNSPRKMAFAIKSNRIPFLTANPPCGLLKPRERVIIWVNVQKFDPSELEGRRDRIAFDYVFCDHETSKFSHSLLQGTETRRRKNIHIVYNP